MNEGDPVVGTWQRVVLAVRQSFDQLPLFWVALVAAIGAVAMAPQISRVILQAGPHGGWLFFGYVMFLLFLAYFYLVSMFVMHRPYPLQRWRSRMWSIPGWVRWLPEFCCAPLERLVHRLGRHGESACHRLAVIGAVVALLGGVGAGLLFFYGQLWSRLGSAVFIWAGLWMLAAGVWLLFVAKAAFAGAGSDPGRKPGQRTLLVGRFLSWLIFPLLFGEALWFLADSAITPVFSFRLFTVWALVHVLSTCVLAALTVDVLHLETTHWPVRATAVVGSVVLYAVFESTAVVEPVRAESAAATEAVDESMDGERARWLARLMRRVEQVPQGQGPVVFVAASGGGSRAAIFTALTLEMLARTPLRAAAGAVGMAEGQRSWAQNIALISSVSGGSLAAASFVAGYHADEWRQTVDEVRNTTPAELEYRAACAGRARVLMLRREAEERRPPQVAGGEDAAQWESLDLEGLARMSAAGELIGWLGAERVRVEDSLLAAKTAADGPLAGADDFDVLSDHAGRLEAYRDALDAAAWLETAHDDQETAEDVTGGRSSLYHWVHHSRFFDLMCLDFMAPILRGVLVPGMSRGDALRVFWEEEFGWGGLDNANWQQRATSPLLVINTTAVRTGTRLMIGFPQLPTLVLPELGGTESLGTHFPLSLAMAVRLSSNFPYGFRVNELRLEEAAARRRDQMLPPTSRERGRWTRRVLDGGIVDNTGLDTIHDLLLWIADQAGQAEAIAPAAGRPESPTAAAKSPALAALLLQRLSERGVVILEIDSGAKPSKRTPSTLASVREPLQALANAGSVASARVRDRFLVAMAAAVDPAVRGFDDDNALRNSLVMHVVLQCNHNTSLEGDDEEVMTAWTLAPAGKAEVLARFMIELGRWNRVHGLVVDQIERILEQRQQTVAVTVAEIEEPAEFTKALEPYVRQVDSLEKQGLLREGNAKIKEFEAARSKLELMVQERSETGSREQMIQLKRQMPDLNRLIEQKRGESSVRQRAPIDRSRRALERAERPLRRLK